MKLSIFEAAREVPERVAIVTGERELDYRELAERVAGEIERWPIDVAKVAISGELGLGAVVQILAAIELGVPVVPLHPRWSEGERRRWVEELAPCPFLEPPVEEHRIPFGELRPIEPETPLAILATSGSSGRPKGVILSRRAFLASAEASAKNLGWRDGDRWLLSLPLAHVGGLSVVTRTLVARRTVVLDEAGSFDPQRLAETIEKRRVTLLSLVPTQLRRMLELRWRPSEHLRAVLVGGAAAPAALLAEAEARGWPVLTTYGLTEACSQVATQRPGSERGGKTSVGRPLPGVEVRVREGVIEVRGPTLMSGYVGVEEDRRNSTGTFQQSHVGAPLVGALGVEKRAATRAAPTVSDRFQNSTGTFLSADIERDFVDGGWFVTGDLGRLDEAGRLHVFGRSDELIVSGGENVYPAEVEAALEEHPGIRAACVFGVEDAAWGQRVAAVLEGEPLQDGELADFLGERLARFKRPSRVAWITELPRRPNGKLDRARLRRTFDGE